MRAIRAFKGAKAYVGRNRYLILTSLVVLVIAVAYTGGQFLTGGSLTLAEKSSVVPLFTVIRVAVYVCVVISLGTRFGQAGNYRWWESPLTLKVIVSLVVFELLVVQEGLILIGEGLAEQW